MSGLDHRELPWGPWPKSDRFEAVGEALDLLIGIAQRARAGGAVATQAGTLDGIGQDLPKCGGKMLSTSRWNENPAVWRDDLEGARLGRRDDGKAA